MNNTRLKQLQAQKDEILCEFTRKVTQANEEFRLKMGALNKEEERTHILARNDVRKGRSNMSEEAVETVIGAGMLVILALILGMM